MSTTNPELTKRVEGTKQATEKAKQRLLTTFSFVPDDKLGWSPSPANARSAVWIVGHCGMANHAFAAILRGESVPMPSNPAEAAAQIRAAGHDITGRDEAVRLLEESTAAVLGALDAVTAPMLSTAPASPFGPMPFAFWMDVAADHMAGHASQIDYLQTIWGDFEDHM